MSEYPEHDKQALVIDEAHVIGPFLDWVGTQGWRLCDLDDSEEEFEPVWLSIQDIIARYLDVDLDTIEAEKMQMLEEIRWANLKQETKDS